MPTRLVVRGHALRGYGLALLFRSHGDQHVVVRAQCLFNRADRAPLFASLGDRLGFPLSDLWNHPGCEDPATTQGPRARRL
jgi:hypothetical protein